jgi:hypothetical protein
MADTLSNGIVARTYQPTPLSLNGGRLAKQASGAAAAGSDLLINH